jgi:hypothetical protein
MAKSQKLDENTVGWHAPETLGQSELADRLAAASSPEEALEILNSRPTVGQFRVLEDANALVDGPDGTTVRGPKWGDLAVWVNENPDDREDNAGHFELYDEGRHGSPYTPTVQGA